LPGGVEDPPGDVCFQNHFLGFSSEPLGSSVVSPGDANWWFS